MVLMRKKCAWMVLDVSSELYVVSGPSVVTANGGSSMVASSSSSVSNKPAPAKPPPEIITLD